MKKRRKRTAALAAAALLLVSFTGCNQVPKGYVPEGYVPEGYVPEGYVPAGYISVEDVEALFAALSLPVGYLDGNSGEITNEDEAEISKEIVEMESAFVAADAPQVTARDWSIYTSQLAKEGLMFEESALYERLDELCRRYMDSAALDGVAIQGTSSKVSDMVDFGDLNLTKEQASNLAFWFKYNNPQYYFITSSIVTTSSQRLGFVMYDFAVDGEERVRITNEMFGKLDGWIEAAGKGGDTTWQKEFSANNLLCKNIFYNDEYAANYDLMGQTLYSAVMLEGTVCAGYAGAFSAIMNALGTETMVALSPTHAWNVVRYDDGNYYAVDVTWNDNKNDDNNPNNQYFNVGETTLKMGDGGVHTYSARYMTWSPEISRDDCPDGGQVSSITQLDMPKNLRVTSQEDGKIHVAWDPVEGAVGYDIEIFSGDKTKILVSQQLETSSVSLTYGSRDSMAVRVRAKAGNGEADGVSEWSEFLSIETEVKGASRPEAITLGAPENVRAVKEEPRSLSFAWDPVEGADQYEFVLFRDSQYTETWSNSFKTEPQAGYMKFHPDTTYYFGVRAMKTVDGKDYYSDWNYFSHKTPDEASGSAAPQKPSAPENVRTTATGENKAAITWDSVPEATGYQIRLYKDSAYKEIWTEFSKTGTELMIKNVKEGANYYCAVRAVKTADGQEAYSDWVTWTYSHVWEPAAYELAPPANVKTFYLEEDTCRTSWDAVEGATGYEINKYKDSAYKEVIGQYSFKQTFFNGINSVEGETYHYGIRAVKSVDGQEIYSDWVHFSYIFKKGSSDDLNIQEKH